MTDVIGGRVKTETQRRRPREDGSRGQSDVATARESQESPGAGRGKEGFFPRVYVGITVLLISLFQNPFQNGKRINCCYSKPYGSPRKKRKSLRRSHVCSVEEEEVGGLFKFYVGDMNRNWPVR